MTVQNDPGAANRELTARIARLTWIGRIASVLAGLAVAAVVVVFLVGTVSPASGTHRGRGGRGNAMVFAVGVSVGFVLPFLATRRLFRWLMGVRRARWIAELAAKHNCDAERLRRLAEALSELA